MIASTYFYYWTGKENYIYVFLTGFSTWLGAHLLEYLSEKIEQIRKDKTTEKQKREKNKDKVIRLRRMILWGVILLNFGVLAYIKYAKKFFSNSALGLVLPLGISFYMFQSIGYLIDVYNQKYKVEKNLAKYMLFVAYFPQMIQGPINRYDVLSAQIEKEHKWNWEIATKAMYRIAYGLLKKFAIANIYSGIIADIFDKPNKEYAGATILFGILLYSLQQYADFSGGIDMVLGVSELFDS